MENRRGNTTVLLLVVAILTGTTAGQDQQQPSQVGPSRGRQQGFQTDRQRRMPAVRQRMRLIGTVQETRQITLAQQEQAHTFAKVRTRQGQTVVVDLGPAGQVDQLNLSEGDRIQAQGTIAMVNQRPVLMAGRVQANNQTITPERPRTTPTRRLKGTIRETQVRELEGADRPAHVVALLELESGQRVPVDLGRQQDLEHVPITEGKTIIVLARPVPIGNERILVAEQMSIDGRRIDARWLSTRQQQPQGQPPTRQQEQTRF